ncbi:MAG: four-helix bundle copper-binding protein [Candidatus Kryptoniota bacterium]
MYERKCAQILRDCAQLP